MFASIKYLEYVVFSEHYAERIKYRVSSSK